MKKVIFKAQTKAGQIQFPKPLPASQFLPEWYKKTPVFTFGEKQPGLAQDGIGVSNFSIKGCVPFQDAMTSGYIFTLPCDVQVLLKDDGYFYLKWMSTDYAPADTHSPQQAGLLPKSSDSNPFPFKWFTDWTMKTPKGYSTVFTHPLNRYDLPFRTLSGVVDTDKHPIATNFPFQLIEQPSYPYIIEAGTPIAQAIPFKRESWVSGYEDANEKDFDIAINKLNSKIGRAYRNFWWTKKTYR